MSQNNYEDIKIVRIFIKMWLVKERFWSVARPKIIRKQVDKEVGKNHTLCHKNNRALGLVMINKTLSFVVGSEVFFISLMLRTGCDEIEWKIVDCRICLVAWRLRKRR